MEHSNKSAIHYRNNETDTENAGSSIWKFAIRYRKQCGNADLITVYRRNELGMREIPIGFPLNPAREYPSADGLFTKGEFLSLALLKSLSRKLSLRIYAIGFPMEGSFEYCFQIKCSCFDPSADGLSMTETALGKIFGTDFLELAFLLCIGIIRIENGCFDKLSMTNAFFCYLTHST